MSIPFVQQCDQCSSQLTIKKEELVGKRIRCPRCGAPLLVTAPTEFDNDVYEPDPWELEDAADEGSSSPSEDHWNENWDDQTAGHRGERKRKSSSQSSRTGKDAPRKNQATKSGKGSRTRAAKSKSSPGWLVPAAVGAGVFLALVIGVLLFWPGGKPIEKLAEAEGANSSEARTETTANSKADSQSEPEDQTEQPEQGKQITEVFAPKETASDPAPPTVVKNQPPAPVLGNIQERPVYLNNFVLVYRNHAPAGVYGGLCLQQSETQTFIWVADTATADPPGERSYAVEFQLDQANRKRFRARFIGTLAGGKLLEVAAPDVPRIPEIPWSENRIRSATGNPIRIIGLRSSDSSAFEWVDTETTWGPGDAPSETPPGLQSGAIVSIPGQGTVAMFNSQGRRRLVEYHAGLRPFFVVQATYNVKNPLPLEQVIDDEPTRNLVGSIYPIEIRVSNAYGIVPDELWICSAFDVESGMSYLEPTYDEPISEKMVAYPVELKQRPRQTLTGHTNLTEYRVNVPFPPDFPFPEIPVVVQCRWKTLHGQVVWTQPQLMNVSNRAFQNATHVLLRAATTAYKQKDGESPSLTKVTIPPSQPQAASQVWTLASPTPHMHMIDEFTWSRSGETFCVATTLGRIQLVSAENRTELRRLNLLVSCQDVDNSSEGFVVLAGQRLWILDEETLEIRKQISVPGAVHLAATLDSPIAVVAGDDDLWRVDLRAERPEPLLIGGQSEFAIPAGKITAINMQPNGDEILVVDEARVHRLKIDTNVAQRQESSAMMGELESASFDRQGTYVAVTRWKFLSDPSLPSGRTIVFETNDLSNPLLGFDNFTGFDSYTGAILTEVDRTVMPPVYKTVFLNGNGGVLHTSGQTHQPTRGSASPDGKHLFVLNSNRTAVEDLRPEFAHEEDAFLPKELSFEPNMINASAVREVHNVDNWKISTLSISAERLSESIPGLALPTTILLDLAWSSQGEKCFLLTTECKLYSLRVADQLLESVTEIPQANGLVVTSEGLVVSRGTINELLLFDEDTLALKKRFQTNSIGQFTGNPQSSRLWQLRKGNPGVETDEWTLLSSFDLSTGTTGREFGLDELKFMTKAFVDPGASDRYKYDRLIQIATTRDNRFLFASDGRILGKFGIHGEELAFHELAPTFAASPVFPILIGADSSAVALGIGLLSSTKLPKTFGIQVRSTSDLETVMKTVPRVENADIFALGSSNSNLYATTEENIFVFGAENSWHSVPLPIETGKTQLAVHPFADQLLMFGSKLYWVEPPDVQ